MKHSITNPTPTDSIVEDLLTDETNMILLQRGFLEYKFADEDRKITHYRCIIVEKDRDRKSVVQGKSVDLGCRRIIKKKQK